jgi:hypothetical protein
MISLQGTYGYYLCDPLGYRLTRDIYVTNGLTKLAIEDMFATQFRNGTQKAEWYFGLIDSDDFSAVDDEQDSMSSHAGWIEVEDYDESARPAWGPDAPASQTIANSLKATFTIDLAKDIRGFFLASDSTKGGTDGILWSTAVLDVLQSTQPGQLLKVFYSLLGQEG